jgi:hypothetical protein
MSMGRRISREIKTALKNGGIEKIITWTQTAKSQKRASLIGYTLNYIIINRLIPI